MTKQNNALRLAELLFAAVQIYPQRSEDEPGGYASEVDQVMDEAAAELRRQHTRIAELEAELEAVGAGGVSGPLMGRASLAASVGSEPVAHLWQHSETGRTRVLMPDMVVDACATWLLVGPLYLHPSPPEGMVEGWQDIATAPKDGTYLLLWEQYSTNPFVGCWAFGSWSVSHEHVDAEGGWDGAIVVDSISQDRITHWIPLPPSPATSAGSGKGE